MSTAMYVRVIHHFKLYFIIMVIYGLLEQNAFSLHGFHKCFHDANAHSWTTSLSSRSI